MRIFLKLGGSLITDKDKPYTARTQVIADIAKEIVAARKTDPDMELLIGHGSGSFGILPPGTTTRAMVFPALMNGRDSRKYGTPPAA